MFGKLAGRERRYERVPATELSAAPWGTNGHGPDSGSGLSTAVLSVTGMTCGACTSAVEAALRALPGVDEVAASLLQHTAEVRFDASAATPEALAAAVEDCGFDACVLEVLPARAAAHAAASSSGRGGAPNGGAAAPASPRLGSAGGSGGSGNGARGPQVARITVGGMTCAACSGAVERALAAVQGVERAGVSLATGEAEVVFDGGAAATKQLVAAVEDAGFEATLVSMGGAEQCRIAVGGMTCAACSGAVERALVAVPGVARAAVDLLGHSAQVWFDANATGPRAFIAAVEDCGFDAALAPPGGAGDGAGGGAQRAELAEWARLLKWASLLTVPLFGIAMVLPMLGVHALSAVRVAGFPLDSLLKWLLATPVQYVIGWRFHRGAWKALRRGAANMDVLVSLGTNASYVYSVICVIGGAAAHAHAHGAAGGAAAAYTPTDFFETCAILITVVILGKYLECSAKGRTSDAIKALLALAPESALLCELDEGGGVVGTREVPSALVHKGDVLKVLPGYRVPADGEVLEGSSYVNEAMITGESAPVARGPGDPLIGGTLNAGGALLMRATRVGGDTVLAQIVRLVRRAQMSKAPIQAFADAVAAVFVPAVVTLAVLTWAGWFIAGSIEAYPEEWLPQGHSHFLFALLFGIAVLVIACPCALGLATPTAVMVGTGVGAAHGILIKGGDALERGSHVNTVIFDKTGTLTLGRPEVTECRMLDARYSLRQVCELAAAAEAASEHPLARAVIEYAAALLAADAARPPGSPACGAAGGPAAPPRQCAAPGSPARRPGGRGSGSAPGSPARRPRPGAAGGSGTGLHSAGGSSVWSAEGGAATPRRLSRALRGAGLSVADVQPHPGRGITALVPQGERAGGGGRWQHGGSSGGGGAPPAGGGGGGGGGKPPLHLAIGNRLLMREQGVAVSGEAEAFMQEREDAGETCVVVAVERSAVAAMAVADPLKPEAAAVVAALQAQGIECHLLTGDTWRTARAVAGRVGVASVHAEVLPAGKATMVQEQQALGRVVAMVGDGVNDAPALAAADVGVAIGSGTDIAVEAADYVLMRSNLEQVLTALDLSRATYRRIKANFVFAMGYNITMIPIAAGVLYPWFHVQLPPWIAGGCMVLSSISVVASSLMLRRYRPPRLPAQPLAAVRVAR